MAHPHAALPQTHRRLGSHHGDPRRADLRTAAFFDGWTDFTTPTDALLSTLYVVLFYTAPGMSKTFLTQRTGNSWLHVWAYHAIAPHTLIDTPMMTKVFSIH